MGLGITLYSLGIFEWRQLLQWAGSYTQHWWMAALLILLQALLFMLALPGSTLLWVVAPLYPPLTATLMLVAGSTLGGLGGYLFARLMTEKWVGHIRGNRFFHLLEKRGDFLTQCALRTLPSFPHSVINYSAGLLRLPLIPFLSAAVLGLSVKTILYAIAIHNAVMAADISELVRIKVLAPLIILALLFVLAEMLQRRLAAAHKEGSGP